MDSVDAICFAADATLGKLCKWLRILGFDTIFDPGAAPDSFAEYGERRILLTRTRRIRIKNVSHKLVFITSNDPFEQLKEVIQTLGIDPADIRMFSICTRCNVSVTQVDKSSVRRRVPDYVWETHDTFRSCNRCNRIYWSGSHTARSRAIVDGLFD
jgi:uncharacterized protein with PIN domain